MLLALALVLVIHTKNADFDEMKSCGGDSKTLYILGDQVVEWYNSVQGHAWIEGCINATEVTEVFDPDLIVQYAYYQLFVDNTVWPTIPETAKCKEVQLRGVTPIGAWGGCSQLEELEIFPPMNLSLTSPDWLYNCQQLRQLRLNELNVTQIKTIMDSLFKVDEVNLVILNVEDILWNPIFPSARESHLWIRTLNFGTPYSDILATKNISWAAVSETFVWQLSLLPRLETIYTSRFENLDWCASVNYTSVKFEALKKVLLQGTATSEMCFGSLRVCPNLTRLEITIDRTKFSELLSTCGAHLRVDFVNSVLFNREDYLMLSDCKEVQKSRITLNNLKSDINCDCSGQSLWMTKAIIEGFLSTPGLTCSDGSALEDQPCDWLYCDRVACDTKCVCCDDTSNGTVADCRDVNLKTIPDEVLLLSNLTELLVPNSSISSLPERFPESLIFVDLSGNNLFNDMDASGIMSLFAVPERVVRLALNPIICSCDHQLLIKELQKYKNQIEDYNAIVCAGENKKLSEVDTAMICQTRDRTANTLLVVSVALVVAVFALVLGVSLYYRQHVKIYLFARGWCLCCINEEDLDADRLYDVFLSFCYSDERIVIDELLPKLEQEYAVCVHFRDWNPGAMIPSQIWKSVEQSKRTVVVLSRNFVKSMWGLLEFRSAYVSGLAEGRVRVVMVVLDDVLEEVDLEGELKSYVRLNTYVKWGDPWFWDKLKFALPHRPVLNNTQRNVENAGNFNILSQEPQIEMLAIGAGNEQDAIINDFVVSTGD